ncbi:MAG: phage integrase N-terminal SAM-like domain-containing protein [Phycisphaerae bacterium]|jgi:hypothetical protein|nr:phage integrase N-terminal SAM-like domain-containing protein [Phycisphaerae bacterium]
MKLTDQIRGRLHAMHYSYRTEQSYVRWVVRFIHFHKLQHPMIRGEVLGFKFISRLATGPYRLESAVTTTRKP